MASESSTFHTSLANVADLEEFIHELHERLGDRELKHGDDLSALAAELDLQIPAFLDGEPLIYEVHGQRDHDVDGRAIVLVRPSGITNPVAEMKIYCHRWGRFTVCLECGWIYCKIVISGRF